MRMPVKRLPHRLLYSEPPLRLTLGGGQKKRFKDQIKSSLSKCRIPSARLEELASDRDEWRVQGQGG